MAERRAVGEVGKVDGKTKARRVYLAQGSYRVLRTGRVNRTPAHVQRSPVLEARAGTDIRWAALLVALTLARF